jgi:hypothetical protein
MEFNPKFNYLMLKSSCINFCNTSNSDSIFQMSQSKELKSLGNWYSFAWQVI